MSLDSADSIAGIHPPVTRLGALTSLRFVAALLIVVLNLHGKFAIPDGLEAWGFGTGVSFFFVLSGFILTYVYSSRRNVGKWDFIVTLTQ